MTDIFASIGIGIGIALVLFFVIFLATRDTTHYVNSNGNEQFSGKSLNSARMCLYGGVLAIAAMDTYFILNGAKVLSTIGLTILIYPLASLILATVISSKLKCNDKGNDEHMQQGFLVVAILNIIVTSVFAMLILNHFNLI